MQTDVSPAVSSEPTFEAAAFFAASGASEQVTAGEKTEEGRKPRALIVDDATDVTEMIAIFLKHAGYDAVMAFSAPAALDAMKVDRFDIIVSDIGMPGMNGYELAETIRSTPGYESVPMIAVTGFSLYDDKGKALESGFNAHLPKPINPMALLELMDSLRR
jgi:CheY-like chemotaxis protein